MPDILWGVFGVILALSLVAAGFAAGWKLNNLYREKTATAIKQELSEQEKRRLKEDHDAFQQLMNYSSDIAYGMVSPEDVTGYHR